MTNASRPSLRDEQKALTRRRLLDSAETVFARGGFRGASVEEIAREAGATSGALYSNFASKEDLFLALFEERIATDVGDYSQIIAEGATVEEQARGAADHWMEILRERPDYFPLLMEFWAYAIREPRPARASGRTFRGASLGQRSPVPGGGASGRATHRMPRQASSSGSSSTLSATGWHWRSWSIPRPFPTALLRGHAVAHLQGC